MNKKQIFNVIARQSSPSFPVAEELRILKLGVPTGGRVFFGTGNDIDIVVQEDHDKDITAMNLLSNYRCYYSGADCNQPFYYSIYYKSNIFPIPVNLILCHTEEEFSKWIYATAEMSKILRHDDVLRIAYKLDKERRVGVFERFKDSCPKEINLFKYIGETQLHWNNWCKHYDLCRSKEEETNGQ